MKLAIAAVVLALSMPVAADQMVINGNAIRDGDSVAKLMQYAGRPLTKVIKTDRDHGVIQEWVYIEDGTQYAVKIKSGQIVAIEWQHAN